MREYGVSYFSVSFPSIHLFGWLDFITQCAKCQGNFGNGRKKSWRAESPAAPAFSLLSRPPSPKGKDRPPTPFPSGEGGDYKLILPGAPPPAPRHQTVYGTDIPCRCSTPAGGLPSWSPAAPAFSFVSAPIPPTPFPSGEGGDYKFILPGAPPPAPRHQTVYGTDSPCRCSTPEGGGRCPGKARARGGG